MRIFPRHLRRKSLGHWAVIFWKTCSLKIMKIVTCLPTNMIFSTLLGFLELFFKNSRAKYSRLSYNFCRNRPSVTFKRLTGFLLRTMFDEIFYQTFWSLRYLLQDLFIKQIFFKSIIEHYCTLLRNLSSKRRHKHFTFLCLFLNNLK